MGDLDQENTVLHCRKGMAISGINLWISPIPHDLHSRSHILFHCHQLLFDWFMMCQKEIWVLSNMNARGRTQARKCKADRHLPGLTPKSAKQHFLASFNDNFLCIIGASAHGALCVFLIFREVWWSLCLTKATTEMKKSSNCTIQTQSVL